MRGVGGGEDATCHLHVWAVFAMGEALALAANFDMRASTCEHMHARLIQADKQLESPAFSHFGASMWHTRTFEHDLVFIVRM